MDTLSIQKQAESLQYARSGYGKNVIAATLSENFSEKFSENDFDLQTSAEG